MKELTAEWVSKAEGDYETAERELEVEDSPNYDAVGFHAQQCVEKYLKARLAESGIAFPKTHDLKVLLDLIDPQEEEWDDLEEDLHALSGLAVEVRYPGYETELEDAEKAFETAQSARALIRQSLGLDLLTKPDDPVTD
jgi:HEPN domain-containing protein